MQLLTSIVTDLDASITENKLDSTVQLPNFRSVGSWTVACCIRVLNIVHAG
jgi:hypothetical protein